VRRIFPRYGFLSIQTKISESCLYLDIKMAAPQEAVFRFSEYAVLRGFLSRKEKFFGIACNRCTLRWFLFCCMIFYMVGKLKCKVVVMRNIDFFITTTYNEDRKECCIWHIQ